MMRFDVESSTVMETCCRLHVGDSDIDAVEERGE